MKKIVGICLLIVVFNLSLSVCKAQLNTGEIMLIGFNGDVNDGLSLLALVDIPASTTIYLTDNSWNGTSLATNEGTLNWNSGASILSAGTIINLLSLNNGSRSASVGTITSESGSFNISVSSEVVLLFHGTDAVTPTTFLTGISNNGLGNLTGTGLADGVNAIDLPSSADVAAYTGVTTCNSTVADCAAQLADVSNWSSENDSGDQSNDGGIDFPASVPTSFGGTALPVDLISFEGIASNSTVTLQWQTASELNNDYFEVSRSDDGINFSALGIVKGKGTTSSKSSYKFADNGASGVSSYYYQLTQVDFDGSSEQFPLIYVPADNSLEKALVFPNPVIADQISLVATDKMENVELLDFTGRVVRIFHPVDAESKLDLTGMEAGQFLLRINYALKSETLRISKN